MKKVTILVAMIAVFSLASAIAGAAGKGIVFTRVGVGLGIDTADVRAELGEKDAVGLVVGLTSFSGDLDGSRFGFGVNYLHRLAEPKPVALHLLGGFMVNTYDKYPMTIEGVSIAGGNFTKFALFGGIGAEYFFPGTTQVSIEANTGFQLVNVSGDGKGTVFGIAPIPTGGFMLRYYFE